jgi:hypothetical protein
VWFMVYLLQYSELRLIKINWTKLINRVSMNREEKEYL